MKEYQRKTEECKFSELPIYISQAFEKYVEKQGWEKLGNILYCCQTSSTPLKQSFISKIFGGGNFAELTTILITSSHLIWGTVDRKNEIVILSTRLNDLEMSEFQSNLLEDCGIQVWGFINQSPKKSQAFIGLGEEAAAHKFRQILQEAIGK